MIGEPEDLRKDQVTMLLLIFKNALFGRYTVSALGIWKCVGLFPPPHGRSLSRDLSFPEQWIGTLHNLIEKFHFIFFFDHSSLPYWNDILFLSSKCHKQFNMRLLYREALWSRDM